MMRLILAEDQAMVRGALAALLNLEDDMEVIGEASEGRQALQMIQDLVPDICILDIEMPKLSGLDVAQEVKRLKLPSKVVILTTFGRSGYLQRALHAGVYGYLLKDAPVEELAKALRNVYLGKRMISPELAVTAWEETNPLSEREQEVLRLAAQGMSTVQIAKHLFLTEGTVRNYVSEILHKLDAQNRLEAISVATEKGWL